MQRSILLALLNGSALIAARVPVSAQTDEMPKVGFVAGASGYLQMAVTNQAFFDGLKDAGYIDGSTMAVIFRTAEGNMSLMPGLVEEILDEGVDILVVSTSPGCVAAQKATTDIPVLCISVQNDPVAEGLTSSLASGNGNVVGVHSYLVDGIEQQLSSIEKLMPDLQTLGVLHNPDNPTHLALLEDWERAAGERDVAIVAMPTKVAADLAASIESARAEGVQMAIGLLGADTYAMRQDIAEAAESLDLPIAMDTPGGYTQMGGLATIGVDIVPLYRRGALEQMVPMLEGTAPSALPWIGPSEITTTVNDEVAERFKLSAAR